jgi:hypothetical protein
VGFFEGAVGRAGEMGGRLTQRRDASASHSLGEFPHAVVRIECPRCHRRRDGLLARFEADIALPDLLLALAQCERRQDFSRPCGARFTDLSAK